MAAAEATKRRRGPRFGNDDWNYFKAIVAADIKTATKAITEATDDEDAAPHIERLAALMDRHRKLKAIPSIERKPPVQRKKTEKRAIEPKQDAAAPPSAPEKPEPKKGTKTADDGRGTMLVRIDNARKNAVMEDEQYHQIIADATDNRHSDRESLNEAELGDLTAVYRALIQYL